MAARWTRASGRADAITPAIRAGSPTSPTVHERTVAATSAGRSTRSTAATSCPREASSATTCRPTLPPAPVTTMRIRRPSLAAASPVRTAAGAPPVRGCRAQASWSSRRPSPGRSDGAKQPSAGSTVGATSTSSLTHGSAKSLKCSRTSHVARRRREMDVGGGRDRAADVVRCQRQVVGLRPAGQPAQAGEPAEVGEIGLDDVDVAAFDERRASADRVDPLAGRDGQVGRRANAGGAVRRAPAGSAPRSRRGANGCELGGDPGSRSGENRPCISIMISMSGPDRVPDRGHDVASDGPALGRGQLGRWPLRTGRASTPGSRARRRWRRARRCGRARGRPGTSRWRTPGRGPGTDRPSSFQTGTPSDWPMRSHAGDVEGGQRGLADLAGAPVLGALDVPGKPLDVERIAPMT